MTIERTGKLTLTKDDGSVIYVWLAKKSNTITLQSSKQRKDSTPYGDAILFPSGQATVFPSGSFKTWEIFRH